MKRAVILHGTLGSPEGNWFSWLEHELLDRNLDVWVPALPGAEQPSLRQWLTFIHENRPFELDEETVIIGHSSGATLALVLAQTNTRPIGGIAAVSVFDDNSLNWEPNARLFDVALEYGRIRSNVRKLLFIHSDNDPYVPLEKARQIAEQCGETTVVIGEQGHFNTEQGPEYEQFPKLLELLDEHQMI